MNYSFTNTAPTLQAQCHNSSLSKGEQVKEPEGFNQTQKEKIN